MSDKKSISWILNFTSKLKVEEERIKCLRANDNNAMRTVLGYAFSPHIKWILPQGAPPYTPNEESNSVNTLYTEWRKFYLFVEGGNPDLHPVRREKIFVDLLSTLSPDDAKMIISIKDGVMPFKNITAELVQKAFPGIF